MGFTWTEIKKWASERGLSPKKKPKESIYTWNDKEYQDLDSLVISLFNHITDNKWIEHQKKYKNENN